MARTFHHQAVIDMAKLEGRTVRAYLSEFEATDAAEIASKARGIASTTVESRPVEYDGRTYHLWFLTVVADRAVRP